MTKLKAKVELLNRITAIGFTFEEAQQLRRISMTLSKWGELECGDEHGRGIERDEVTGKPFMTYDTGQNGKRGRYPIADREAGALKRLKAIILARNTREAMPGDTLNLITPYHQGDPRGCALYLLKGSDLSPVYSIDQIYTRGLAVCA